MKTNIKRANNSEYFLWQSPEDWMTNQEGKQMQERRYYVCRATRHVILPHDERINRPDCPYYLRFIECLHLPYSERKANDLCAPKYVDRVYELRKAVFPADWFPGICDEWVKHNADFIPSPFARAYADIVTAVEIDKLQDRVW